MAALVENTVMTIAMTGAWEAAWKGLRGCYAAATWAKAQLAKQRLTEAHDNLSPPWGGPRGGPSLAGQIRSVA